MESCGLHIMYTIFILWLASTQVKRDEDKGVMVVVTTAGTRAEDKGVMAVITTAGTRAEDEGVMAVITTAGTMLAWRSGYVRYLLDL